MCSLSGSPNESRPFTGWNHAGRRPAVSAAYASVYTGYLQKVFPAVSCYATVLFETNLYSVPCRYVGKEYHGKSLSPPHRGVDRRNSGCPSRPTVWPLGRIFGLAPLSAHPGAERQGDPVRKTCQGMRFLAEFLNWLERQPLTAKEWWHFWGNVPMLAMPP